MKPIIGKDYWPNPVLRQMPKHWVIEESHKDSTRWHWWKSGDAWIGLFCLVVGAVACAVILTETLA